MESWRHLACVFWKAASLVVYLGTGEFLLKRKANGGAVILARTLITSTVIFLIAVGLRERLAPDATWSLSSSALRAAISDGIALFGAIFAGVYAALYMRFSSQWTYLAGVYNALMRMQVQVPDNGGDPERRRSYAAWWAGFIEDAEEVHLASKAMYASVIAGLLGDRAVRDTYERAAIGSDRLVKLETRLREALGDETFDRRVSDGASIAADRAARSALANSQTGSAT